MSDCKTLKGEAQDTWVMAGLEKRVREIPSAAAKTVKISAHGEAKIIRRMKVKFEAPERDPWCADPTNNVLGASLPESPKCAASSIIVNGESYELRKAIRPEDAAKIARRLGAKFGQNMIDVDLGSDL